MKCKLSVFCVLAIALLLADFARVQASPVKAQREAISGFKSKIEGIWFTKCSPDQKTIVKFKFEGIKFSMEATKFFDEKCEKESFKFKTIGSFVVGEPLSGQRFAMDAKVMHVDLILATERSLKEFKDKKFCNISRWYLNEPLDITSCKKDSTVGKFCYGSAVIKDGLLIMAENSDGHDCKTKERRQIKLDEKFPYYRSELPDGLGLNGPKAATK